MRTLLRLFALPIREQGRTVEAALSLLAVRLAFGLLPFPRALRLFRIQRSKPNVARVAAEATEVATAIARAARHVPFRAACLQQAFAALLMLRRRGLAAKVQLGLARDASAKALMAHAWCVCGEVPVTGIEMAGGFIPVAAFVG